MHFRPLRFIGESIQARFSVPPMLEKIPGCPDGFVWRDVDYAISELLSEWHDYRRHGRMENNMRPTHASTARRRGSWGVGQDYYRVRTTTGQIFDIYYDRAPKSADQRKGAWFLDKEVTPED